VRLGNKIGGIMRIILSMLMTILSSLISVQSFAAHPILDLTPKWTDENNKTYTMSDFKNKNIIVTMSYTACKKTCPLTTMATLKKIDNYLNKNKIPFEILIFSFDPENDTPKILAQYKADKKITSPNWHFFTGSLADTKELSKLIGLGEFWAMDDHIIHDFKITAINKNGDLVRTIDWDHRDPAGLFK
jgi:protein SCO1